MRGDRLHRALGHAAGRHHRRAAGAARRPQRGAAPGGVFRRAPTHGRAARGQRVRLRPDVRDRGGPRAVRGYARARHPHGRCARQAAERDDRIDRSGSSRRRGRGRRGSAPRDRLRRGAAGAAELSLVHPLALRIRHPLGVRHRHGRWRWDRLLPLGHDPSVQRPRGGHRHPAHRVYGDGGGRHLVADPPAGDLTASQGGFMRALRILMVAAVIVSVVGTAFAADPSWPKELTFALLSTENAAEIGRRWTPIIAQLEKDLGVKVKYTTATDYRGTIEALKFGKAQLGHLGPKSYVEASTNNYANVEPIAQLQ